LVTIVVVNCGVLFENRSWAQFAEWIRIISYSTLLAIVTFINGWSEWLYLLSISYGIISGVWFNLIQRRNAQIRVA